jgi:outer membrane protein TolC
MQDVPNSAKREARSALAEARVERERSMLVVTELAVRRDAALAWLAVYYAERRAARLADLERENKLLVDTLDARIASGKAMPAERTMARLEALALADRHDDALRDVERARASLRRWVGPRAAEPLDGDPPTFEVSASQVRAEVHRHAEIAPYAAMQAMAQAEVREADAEQRGDWGWELVYSRRPQYSDMVSFQLVFDLPWDRERRQQPQVLAKQKDAARIESERAETMRRHSEELEAQLAELKALDAQHARLERHGIALNTERVALSLASYEAGRADLSAVLMARREAVEARLRLIDLDAQRAALRVRLNTLVAE